MRRWRMIEKQIIYLVWERHNGVDPRLRRAYFNKKSAYKSVEMANNREKKEGSKHRYYVREFEVYKN